MQDPARVIRFATSSGLDGEGAFYVDDLYLKYETYYSDTKYPLLAEADALHAQGILGTGVTIAFVDTGYWDHPDIAFRPEGEARTLAGYDAIQGIQYPVPIRDDGERPRHPRDQHRGEQPRGLGRRVRRRRPRRQPGVGQGL